MIIIQSIQVLPKSFVLKLKKMKNNHFDFLLIFFIFNFFWIFLKDLVSNAQTNPNIEKYQQHTNGAKNLMRRI